MKLDHLERYLIPTKSTFFILDIYSNKCPQNILKETLPATG